ncbi:M48 family metallopeptidase [Roseivirga sp. BDSF3-8]|uniref:M48 family metallopeptidase n=1 Tax=Roseivirga sp. BDSF3-8 TaxID=3241598 RepID=UPI003531D798
MSLNTTAVRSANIKKLTTKARWSIGLFLIAYVLLSLAAFTLVAGCVAISIWAVSTYPSAFTICGAILLVIFSIAVLVFTLRFVFAKHYPQTGHLPEVTESDEPELFALLREVSDEAKTTMPHKVFLSPDIYAAIVFPVSFWHLFLPVKKSLVVGVGLINTCTVQELKSLLAHEFGHFSQANLKIGIYTHLIEQGAYKLLYDNADYYMGLEELGEDDRVNNLLSQATGFLARGIEWVLKKLHGYMAESCLALSRENELRADEISIHIAGSRPFINLNLRSRLAEYTLQKIIELYSVKAGEKVASSNIYTDLKIGLKVLSRFNGYPLVNGLPQPDPDEIRRISHQSLVILNPWDSHPDDLKRISQAEKLNIVSEINIEETAPSLFRNLEHYEEMFTYRYGVGIEPDTPEQVIWEEHEFADELAKLISDSGYYDERYNYYYDGYVPHRFDLNIPPATQLYPDFEQLFAKDKVEKRMKYTALTEDINTLTHISKRDIPVKYFFYDGEQYHHKNAGKLAAAIGEKAKHLETEITSNDQQVYRAFLHLEKEYNQEENLTIIYDKLFRLKEYYHDQKELEERLDRTVDMVQEAKTEKELQNAFIEVEKLQPRLKEHLTSLSMEETFTSFLSQAEKEAINYYLEKPMRYYGNGIIYNENLEIFVSVIVLLKNTYVKAFTITRRAIIDYQIELMNKVPPQKT